MSVLDIKELAWQQSVKCGKEGKKTKQWSYGPKTKKGPHFEVTLYQCASLHKWREYSRKKD